MRTTLLRILEGAAAGLAATVAMTAFLGVTKRVGLLGEPPPKKLTRKILGLRRGPALDVATAGAHIGYGVAMGALSSLVKREASISGGTLFGAAVWALSYAGWIPKAKLMLPPWLDRPGRPTSMFLAHLIYGAVLGAGRKRLAERSLEGKVAVVCGGSRGLGLELAKELARRGAKVAICARTASELAVARRMLERYGVPIFADVCDLRGEMQTRAFLSRVGLTLGSIDILVANAATLTVGPIEALRAADFHEAMGSIFHSTVHPVIAAIPMFQARGQGTIAVINSIGGKLGVPHLAPYSAAKFAQRGFAEALRAELAKDGIHVLVVVPGLMRTGSWTRGRFRGKPAKELAWFGTSAKAPILSIHPRRAARKIVGAIARGDRELSFTPETYIAPLVHDFAPALWDGIMAITARLLPRSANPSANHEARGSDLERSERRRTIATA